MKDFDNVIFFFRSTFECFYGLRKRLIGKERLKIQEREGIIDVWGFHLETPGPGHGPALLTEYMGCSSPISGHHGSLSPLWP